MSEIPSLDRPLKEFRVVTIQHMIKTKDHTPYVKSYTIHQSDVDTFIAACLALHYDPGVNPVTKAQTLPVEAIFVEEFQPSQSYWWCKPHLGQVKNEAGAGLFEASHPHTPYWSSPAYKAQVERDIQAEFDREEAYYALRVSTERQYNIIEGPVYDP